MPQEIIGHCPICQNKLIATKLSCHHCGLELVNDFTLNKFSYLQPKDLEFIEIFLKCHGSFKELQSSLSMSYPTAKKQLDHILTILGLKTPKVKSDNIDVILTKLPIYDDESNAIKLIKSKLNGYNGKATIPLTRGKDFTIYYESFGNGIIATNLPANRILTWKVFDLAVEIINNNGGKAMKGDAMKGKLGDPSLGLNTIEGYVASKAFNTKIGESTIRAITAISSILDWAGICNNGYGYLEFKSSFNP